MFRPFPLALALPIVLTACAVGPDYSKPDAPVTPHFKEAEGWKPASPREAASGTPWWDIYNDPVLSGLEQQVDVNNQTLKASEAAYRQAVAVSEQASAALFPTIDVGATAARSSGATGTTASSTTFKSGISNRFGLSASASWTIDIWGQIRRTIESDVATAQATAAQLAAARLSAQATLANDYFLLRASDEQSRILDDTVTAYQRSYQITKNQYTAGIAQKSDVITAETQLRAVQSQRIATGVTRATLEHAIAVLIGKPPADFSISVAPLATTIPVVPTGIPSELLERRPDIAEAERRMAATNASIGVAIAAYYPALTLSGSYDLTSTAIKNLLNASNGVWSAGGGLTDALFDAGARSAEVDAARANYDGAVANYRQTVLSGFQQVEDELATLRILEQQAEVQNATVQSADEAVRLILNEYKAGTVSYINVVTAQATALSAKQNLATIHQNQLVASATLIEALGGGWDSSKLPASNHLDEPVQLTAAGEVPAKQ